MGLCYIPKGVLMELSTTYQSSRNRTVRENIVADEGSYVILRRLHCAKSHENHCTPCRISCTDGAEIKYSTVQNWYPGNKEGKVVFTIL
jgi:Fe-S cluster assembly protein SufB